MDNWGQHLKEKILHFFKTLTKEPEEGHESLEEDFAGRTNLEAKEINKKRMLCALGVFIFTMLLIVAYSSSHPVAIASKKEKPYTAQYKENGLGAALGKVDGEAIWVERAENRLKTEHKRTMTLQKIIDEQTAGVKAQQEKLDSTQKTMDELGQEMILLKAQLEKLTQDKEENGKGLEEKSASPSFSQPAAKLQMTTLSLTPVALPPAAPMLRTPDNYVPSGSYVIAKILQGADVSAGVLAQSNPVPVFLRAKDNGTLPNGYRSKLHNCSILGAAYGDISSERAYIRLERMSCWKADRYVDFPVYGYVSGPDGRVGVRGKVVMRDGALVSRAFVGGMLSGFSDSFSDNYTENSISPLGSTSTIKNGASLKYGSVQGVSNAADMYAQYNIKRAEQYQPVIEISAGTQVDVVFNQGFYLDGLSNKQHEEKEKETEELQRNQSVGEAAFASSDTSSHLMQQIQSINSGHTAALTQENSVAEKLSPSEPNASFSQEFP